MRIGKYWVKLAGKVSVMCLLNTLACAQLIPMEEADMGEITAGVGIILNDVTFIGDANANIQLTFDTDIGSDAGYVDHIAIYGSTSNATCKSDPNANRAQCTGVTIGAPGDVSSIAKRINLDVKTDAGVSYVELALPTSPLGETTGIDLKFRLVTTGVDATGTLGYADNFFADATWWHISNLKLEDSSFRMWGSGALNSAIKDVNLTTGIPTATTYNGGVAVGVGFQSTINASLDLNVDFASNRAVSASEQYKRFPCTSGASGCNWDPASDTPSGNTVSELSLLGVSVENLTVGFFPYLPLTFGSISRGGGSSAPDFYLEVPMVPNDLTIANAFFAQAAPNITVRQINLGTASGGGVFQLGKDNSQPAVEISGIRIQHLRIETNGN